MSIFITDELADLIIEILEEHVSDYVCDHSIDLCFCRERKIIRTLQEKKEEKVLKLYVPHHKGK
jgi:hypothetical protein